MDKRVLGTKLCIEQISVQAVIFIIKTGKDHQLRKLIMLKEFPAV